MEKRDNLGSILHHLKSLEFKPKTIIDIGVAYGTPGLYGTFDNVRYHLIEPLKEYKNVMQKLKEQYPLSFTIAAAGENEGSISMNVHPDLSGSSILNESEGKHVDGDQRTVLQTTLDKEVEEHNLKGPFLIKIDVQGFELEVLKGANSLLVDTEVIVLEVSLFQFYKNSPTFVETINFMNDRGFSVYDIFSGIYRPLDNALGQVDIVFVKTNGYFRKTHHYASSEQRERITKDRVENLNFKKC
ncbi:MAG: FkbM family methyltransferase [Arcobacter sp.]|uniref:FkbM family methyltransferase n=1 Tax=Arcobacter sp. TaxID=1872629 RepID=UPI003C7426FC